MVQESFLRSLRLWLAGERCGHFPGSLRWPRLFWREESKNSQMLSSPFLLSPHPGFTAQNITVRPWVLPPLFISFPFFTSHCPCPVQVLAWTIALASHKVLSLNFTSSISSHCQCVICPCYSPAQNPPNSPPAGQHALCARWPWKPRNVGVPGIWFQKEKVSFFQ